MRKFIFLEMIIIGVACIIAGYIVQDPIDRTQFLVLAILSSVIGILVASKEE